MCREIELYVQSYDIYVCIYICLQRHLVSRVQLTCRTWVGNLNTCENVRGQPTVTIKTWVSIKLWRSILTNVVGHLLDVSFISSLRVKFMHSSIHILYNRKWMFYLTRTIHDCTWAKYICNCNTTVTGHKETTVCVYLQIVFYLESQEQNHGIVLWLGRVWWSVRHKQAAVPLANVGRL